MKRRIRTIGGADISYNKFETTIYAAIVVLDWKTLEIVDESSIISDTRFPYIPGLLSFREIPALMRAWRNLSRKPDVLMLDGHGIAHPRRMGIAAHFGVVAQTPTLGCGKSRLVGEFEEPDLLAGSQSPLIHRGETIGSVVRTKFKVKPVFVSPGNLMSLKDAVKIVLHTTRGYRLPEPTRRAHQRVNELRLEAKNKQPA